MKNIRPSKIEQRNLTSQWSGRLRAAHFGAPHQRVRRRKREQLSAVERLGSSLNPAKVRSVG